MKALLLNDLHAGVIRGTGTTPATVFRLQDYLLDSFVKAIAPQEAHGTDSIIINGDLFDKFEVSTSQVLAMHDILSGHLENNRRRDLVLIAGNHDLSPRGDKVSSFEFLCRILKDRFGDRVQVILMDGLTQVVSMFTVWAIPHMPNQDLFDMELEKALDLPSGSQLLLHANFDNNFAVRSDHSLNVSREVAQSLADRGIRLIFGHEHQGRSELGGMVLVTGNQWASSVADCLGNDAKNAYILEDGEAPVAIQTQDITQDFEVVHWQDLDEHSAERLFIRVVGKVSQAEAADMMKAYDRFRRRSSAFVVTNAVEVEGVASLEGLDKLALGEIESYDILTELLGLLEPDEAAAVVKLMEKNHAG